MALIDFGMKARRELAEKDRELIELVEIREIQGRLYQSLDRHANSLQRALEEIANSTAKAGSAVRLANIARKALGRPVGGNEQ